MRSAVPHGAASTPALGHARPAAAAALGLLLASGCAPRAVPAADLPLATIRLPEGFHISVYAEGLAGARSLAFSPGGVLYVGTRRAGKVYAARDADGDGRAETTYTIADGLNLPNGVAWRGDALYVAEVHRVIRFDGIDARLESPPEPAVVRDDLPRDRHHGWKFIRFGPDGRLYVPVGAPCNICEVDDPYGAILRMQPDGSGLEVYARGIRNSVGFDWHPDTGELWFTDNGRDWLGDDAPPDELNRAPRAGLHFGYPFCHGRALPDPDLARPDGCSGHTPPVVELGAHVAAIGMRFYTGTRFPAEYRNQIFIAEHGSWNRSQKDGYRIMRVRLDDGSPVEVAPFAEGWLQGNEAWGRPADVLVAPDGALLVSDDAAGVVYRIDHRS